MVYGEENVYIWRLRKIMLYLIIFCSENKLKKLAKKLKFDEIELINIDFIAVFYTWDSIQTRSAYDISVYQDTPLHNLVYTSTSGISCHHRLQRILLYHHRVVCSQICRIETTRSAFESDVVRRKSNKGKVQHNRFTKGWVLFIYTILKQIILC